MAKCMCASLSPPPLPVPCLSLSVGVLCCAQRLALGGGSAAHLTPRRLRGSRAQDCEQSLEGAGGGCRFMDDNRLCVSCANHCVLMASWSSCLLVSSAAQAAGGRECYAYDSAQQWCADHQSNVNCHDGAEDWALPPVGNSAGDQYHTSWCGARPSRPSPLAPC
eukprot:1099242-Rhodomonas_salina.4